MELPSPGNLPHSNGVVVGTGCQETPIRRCIDREDRAFMTLLLQKAPSLHRAEKVGIFLVTEVLDQICDSMAGQTIRWKIKYGPLIICVFQKARAPLL